MFASLAVIQILRIALWSSGFLNVVLIVRISKGVKKIAEFSALRTLGYATNGASPGCQVDELAIELLAAVPASLQIPPSPGRFSLRVIFNVQVTAQMNLHIAATLEDLNPAE